LRRAVCQYKYRDGQNGLNGARNMKFRRDIGRGWRNHSGSDGAQKSVGRCQHSYDPFFAEVPAVEGGLSLVSCCVGRSHFFGSWGSSGPSQSMVKSLPSFPLMAVPASIMSWQGDVHLPSSRPYLSRPWTGLSLMRTLLPALLAH